MARDPWIPMKIGLVVNMLGFLLVLALPETLKPKWSHDGSNLDAVHDDNYPGISRSTSDPSDFHSGPAQDYKQWDQIKALVSNFLRDSRFLIQDWRIILILSTVAASTFSEASGILYLPYVSKRYSLPLSQAAYLTSFRAGISIITLLATLPTISSWLRRRKAYTAFDTNVLLARASFVLATIGLLLIGFASSIGPYLFGVFIATLSTGLDPLLQSLLASLVPPTAIARLFTVTSIVQTVGILTAAPVLTGLYRWGLQRAGQGWIGLPFICCGVLCGGATAMSWLLRIKKRINLPDATSSLTMDIGA